MGAYGSSDWLTPNQDNDNDYKNTKKNKLLGFRSNKIWKKIISVTYLIFWALFFVVIVTEGKNENIAMKDFWITKASDLLTLAILISPYIFLSHTKFREKVPLFNMHNKLASLAGLIIIFVLGVTINSAILEHHTEEYLANAGNNKSEEIENKNMKDTADTEKNKQPTNEQKAEEMLITASVAFSNDDYEKAFNVCDQIVELYPDTSIAQNMGAYLETEYSKLPHYSAVNLMAKYEDNVVNADEECTEQVMIVTGKISDFDKTNNDKNLCVLLESGTYFKGIQLNFNTDKTDDVAKLKKGSTIKVIGKCTGQSGKHFVFFDGDNVMIEDCYLLD